MDYTQRFSLANYVLVRAFAYGSQLAHWRAWGDNWIYGILRFSNFAPWRYHGAWGHVWQVLTRGGSQSLGAEPGGLPTALLALHSHHHHHRDYCLAPTKLAD